MDNKSLRAIIRGDFGSGSSKKMRREGLIPGVIYKSGEDTKNFAVDELEFTKLFRRVGTSSIFDLEMEGYKVPAIVKTVQRDPVKGTVIHIDLQKLDMEQKIKLQVPITLLNRDSIILQPSVLMQMLDTLDIECLPGDIPESVTIDVSGMQFGAPIAVKDLDLMNDETITVLTDVESLICTLNPPVTETVEEETEEEEAVEAEAAPEAEETEE
ncbi:MAG: 50S ribosomal protein L25 [Gudongella sp.]|jgi:large subunit ribosomal protein L25|nr:50S ribosomal protein L25 [Gudongella sp.]